MQCWWDLWPGRLEAELKALDDAGIPYIQDLIAFQSGTLRLELAPIINGDELQLVATFPDLYPYFRVELSAPTLELAHHQNPFAKYLCLMGRRTHFWDTHTTLAQLILEKVPLVLKANTSDELDAVSALEQQQGEPFSEYYVYAPGMVFVQSDWTIPPSTSRSGTFEIATDSTTTHSLQPFIRGVITKVFDAEGQVVQCADPRFRDAFPGSSLWGRWIRVDKPLATQDPVAVIEQLKSFYPDLLHSHPNIVTAGRLQIIGIVFPEEVGYRQVSDGWVFFCILNRLAKKTKQPRMSETFFTRAGRAGPTDLGARVPELEVLRGCVVSVFGLGALGATIALELAKAGVGELRLLDYDIVDPGTMVRWPFGLSAAGLPKVQVISSFIRQNYSFTHVKEYRHRIGGVRDRSEIQLTEMPTDPAIIDQMTAGSAAILDATAEVGIQHVLADKARQEKIPLIGVDATFGAWGGNVFRIRPDDCWMCYREGCRNEEITPPPANIAGEVQPAGCAEPTFTGSSFDLNIIALTAVRLLVSTLCENTAQGYPRCEYDVATISLRTNAGAFQFPAFRGYRIARQKNCPQCGG